MFQHRVITNNYRALDHAYWWHIIHRQSIYDFISVLLIWILSIALQLIYVENEFEI